MTKKRIPDGKRVKMEDGSRGTVIGYLHAYPPRKPYYRIQADHDRKLVIPADKLFIIAQERDPEPERPMELTPEDNLAL